MFPALAALHPPALEFVGLSTVAWVGGCIGIVIGFTRVRKVLPEDEKASEIGEHLQRIRVGNMGGKEQEIVENPVQVFEDPVDPMPPARPTYQPSRTPPVVPQGVPEPIAQTPKQTVKVRYSAELIGEIEVSNLTVDPSSLKYMGFEKKKEA